MEVIRCNIPVGESVTMARLATAQDKFNRELREHMCATYDLVYEVDFTSGGGKVQFVEKLSHDEKRIIGSADIVPIALYGRSKNPEYEQSRENEHDEKPSDEPEPEPDNVEKRPDLPQIKNCEYIYDWTWFWMLPADSVLVRSMHYDASQTASILDDPLPENKTLLEGPIVTGEPMAISYMQSLALEKMQLTCMLNKDVTSMAAEGSGEPIPGEMYICFGCSNLVWEPVPPVPESQQGVVDDASSGDE